MISRLMPYRGGTQPLSWYDRVLTAIRFVVLLVAAVIGAKIGWAVTGPAWFGTSWSARLLGAVVGILLAALLVIALDAASWLSGERQEAWQVRHDQVRQAAGRAPAVPQGVRPTPENLAAADAKRRTAPKGAPPAPPAKRQTPAKRQAPAAVLPDHVDPRPMGPDEQLEQPPRWKPTRELLDAVAGVVAEAGAQGATKDEIGDRLVMVYRGDLTREQIGETLSYLTEPGGRLTSVQESVRPYEYRWYAVAHVQVSRELLEQCMKAVEAASGLVDVVGVRGELRSMGVDPSAPALERAMRVLARQGAVIEVDGQYARAAAQ